MQDVLHKLALVAHRCRELSPNAFNCAAKKSTVVEFLFVEAVRSEGILERPLPSWEDALDRFLDQLAEHTT